MMFDGYTEIDAPDDDVQRVKWSVIDWRLPGNAVLMGPHDLDKLNRYVNAMVKYRVDLDDAWQNPATTLAGLSGDCEDFAILKLAMLLAIGMRPASLAMVIGIVTGAKTEPHAFAVVEVAGTRFILDNRFDTPLPASLGGGKIFATGRFAADYINFTPVKVLLCDGTVRYFEKPFTIADITKEKPPA